MPMVIGCRTDLDIAVSRHRDLLSTTDAVHG
jgi:hypothetical protein